MNGLSILIIDDEKTQAMSLEKALKNKDSNFFTITAFEEIEILKKIEYCYYDIAIVDLRMSKYHINGFTIIEKIKEINPFAKVIIASAFVGEYSVELTKIISLGNIIGVVDKDSFDLFVNQILELLDKRAIEIISNSDLSIQSLRSAYSTLKNENDTFKKGMMFEYFLSSLFGQMGFTRIINRVIDRSRNEVDLAIRNEINDGFFQKFKQYILIECKNKPEDGVDKNDFIVFQNKIKNTNGLCDLGIIATSGYIKKTVFIEAVRESGDVRKIIFLSNPEIEKLINSQNRLESFKEIIDSQIKDN
jgi:DNA-binding NarL/FixJ family response regulator